MYNTRVTYVGRVKYMQSLYMVSYRCIVQHTLDCMLARFYYIHIIQQGTTTTTSGTWEGEKSQWETFGTGWLWGYWHQVLRKHKIYLLFILSLPSLLNWKVEIQDVSLQRVLTRIHQSYQPIPACEIPPTTTAIRGCASDSHPMPSNRTLWSESTPEKGSKGTCTHSSYSPCALFITSVCPDLAKGCNIAEKKKMWHCCLPVQCMCTTTLYGNCWSQTVIQLSNTEDLVPRTTHSALHCECEIFSRQMGRKLLLEWGFEPTIPSLVPSPPLSLYIYIISIYSLLFFFWGGGVHFLLYSPPPPPLYI